MHALMVRKSCTVGMRNAILGNHFNLRLTLDAILVVNYLSFYETLRACLHGGRVPWLEGLTRSPLLHATHLTKTVSGLAWAIF